MRAMFRECPAFNGKIGAWDTSSVTDMSQMFNSFSLFSVSQFNQDIGAWDTSSVTDMSFMFYLCTSFNADIGAWDTSQVKNMRSVLACCDSFNHDIRRWNTSSLMHRGWVSMFERLPLSKAPAFDLNLAPAALQHLGRRLARRAPPAWASDY
jgi:surface protein